MRQLVRSTITFRALPATALPERGDVIEFFGRELSDELVVDKPKYTETLHTYEGALVLALVRGKDRVELVAPRRKR